MRVEIPLSGAKSKLEGTKLDISGPRGSVSRIFNHPKVKLSVEGVNVVLKMEGDKRRDKRMAFTYRAHIKNMIFGVLKGFKYELSLVYAHFPVQMKMQGQEFSLENFYGEKSPRKVLLPQGVKINLLAKEKKIFIESNDIELAGQAVTRLEQLTRIVGKDKRIFQDGIYLVHRGSVEAVK